MATLRIEYTALKVIEIVGEIDTKLDLLICGDRLSIQYRDLTKFLHVAVWRAAHHAYGGLGFVAVSSEDHDLILFRGYRLMRREGWQCTAALDGILDELIDETIGFGVRGSAYVLGRGRGGGLGAGLHPQECGEERE
ncbi:MAG TPA: hypothetical protein VGU23_06080 [Acidobacteriaceae bacterium]|nr:hypothetical protein [Acidobacteriaceae bacterium]